MLTEARRAIHEQSENFNRKYKVLIEIRADLRKSVERFNSRLNKAQERQIRRHGSGIHPTRQAKEKRMKKSEDSLRDLWDTIKQINICIIGVPEEKKEKEAARLFKEIKTENFANLGKENDIQIQETQRI